MKTGLVKGTHLYLLYLLGLTLSGGSGIILHNLKSAEIMELSQYVDGAILCSKY